MLTQERLKELLELTDGGFIWKVANSPSKKAGQIAGGHLCQGYLRVKIDGKFYPAHRLVWLWHNGYFPDFIDHINGNRSDNRIENLRAATKRQNNSNVSWNRKNTSGFKGVVFDKASNKWKAQIAHNRKRYSLGRFDCAEDAHKAYCKKSDELFGEFSNHGTPLHAIKPFPFKEK